MIVCITNISKYVCSHTIYFYTLKQQPHHSNFALTDPSQLPQGEEQRLEESRSARADNHSLGLGFTVRSDGLSGKDCACVRAHNTSHTHTHTHTHTEKEIYLFLSCAFAPCNERAPVPRQPYVRSETRDNRFIWCFRRG